MTPRRIVFLILSFFLFTALAAAADGRPSVGLAVTIKGSADYDRDSLTKCLQQTLDRSSMFFGKTLDGSQKSMEKAGKSAGADYVLSVEVRQGKDRADLLLQRIDLKTSRGDYLSFPLDGSYGRACDAAFIGLLQFFTPPPNQAARQFIDLGDDALKKGDTDLAVGRFSQALEADKNSPLPPRLIARAYQAAGLTMTAMSWYAQALERQAVDPWSTMEAANAALAAGSREQAVAYYEYALNAGARIPMLYKLLGRFYLEGGKSSLAEQSLLDALALDPRDSEILGPLVASLAAEERWADAAKYQAMLNARKPAFDGFRDLVDYYERAHEYSKAVPVLRQMVSAAPGDLHWRRRLGEALEKSGQAEEALAVFTEIRAADPGDGKTAAAIGRIYYQARKYSEAIVALVAAQQLDPFDTDALRLQGMAREMVGDIDGALANYASALRWDSEARASDVTRYLALARKHGRVDEAIENVRAALPYKNLESRRVLVMSIGERLALDGDVDAAIRLYESAMPSLGKFYPPYLALGDLYLQKGDAARAYDAYERASILFDDARVPLYGAQKLHAAGALKPAKDLYDFAYGRDSGNVVTVLSLVEVLLKLDADPDLINAYLNHANTLPKNEAQKETLQFMMILWGFQSDHGDFAASMIKFSLENLPKHPGTKLDLSGWEKWIEAGFMPGRTPLAQDVKNLFERKMTPDAFRAAHRLD